MKMLFGKYRGVSLEFINSGYLQWLIDQDWFLKKYSEPEIIAVERELELREMDNSHFYEDKVIIGGMNNGT